MLVFHALPYLANKKIIPDFAIGKCAVDARRQGCRHIGIFQTLANKADAAQSPIPCGLKNKLFLFLTSSLFCKYIFKCNAVVKY